MFCHFWFRTFLILIFKRNLTLKQSKKTKTHKRGIKLSIDHHIDHHLMEING